jgi:hypothetical protein
VGKIGWHDLWLCYGRCIDRFCYTTQRVEIYLMHCKENFFGGVAPVNMSDTLIQIKRWSARYLEFFLSNFFPYVQGIQRTSTTQIMCYRSSYGYNMIEFVWIRDSFRSWWNEHRMCLIKGVSSYMFSLIQVA